MANHVDGPGPAPAHVLLVDDTDRDVLDIRCRSVVAAFDRLAD